MGKKGYGPIRVRRAYPGEEFTFQQGPCFPYRVYARSLDAPHELSLLCRGCSVFSGGRELPSDGVVPVWVQVNVNVPYHVP